MIMRVMQQHFPQPPQQPSRSGSGWKITFREDRYEKTDPEIVISFVIREMAAR